MAAPHHSMYVDEAYNTIQQEAPYVLAPLSLGMYNNISYRQHDGNALVTYNATGIDHESINVRGKYSTILAADY